MKRLDRDQIPDHITLPACADSIPGLVEFVSSSAWEGGFEDSKIEEIGLAVSEALENIVNFACSDGSGEITIRCAFYDAPALGIDILDTGRQFNMLVAGVFPETEDFIEQGKTPSLKMLKKVVKNIEYRRDPKNKTNILALIIPR